MEFKLQDGSTVPLPTNEDAAKRYLADMIRNRGQLEDGTEVKWSDVYSVLTDAVASPDIRPLLQSSMQVLMREPVEPLMIITGLYDKVQSKGLSTQVLAGAIGAVTAADIPELGTYPEVNFQIGGALQTAWIGKSGLAVHFSDEALRYSTWDVMALNMKQMGAALVRHKEQKAVAFLRTLGTELFNNANPTTSLFGVCTGRGIDMAANGSLTMDDLFKGMAHMAEEGFHPDVLLMNPLFFYQFILDPVMRGMMLAHGGGTYFSRWSGNPGPRDPWSNGAMGAQGPSLGNKLVPNSAASGETATGISGREHGMTSAPPMPSYFPWPFRIEVSPLVPFDASTNLGDIYLLSSGDVGFYLEDEAATTVEWRDEARDSVKMKIRERYGFAVAHEGQGVGVYKNVKLDRNFWDGTIQAHTLDVDSVIPATTPVV